MPAALAARIAAPGLAAAAPAPADPIAKDTLNCAEPLTGFTFSDAEHDLMVQKVAANREHDDALRKIPIDESTVLAAVLADQRARGPIDRRPRL